MLSSPPLRFAACDQRAAPPCARSARLLLDDLGIVVVVDHRREPVRAEQEDVAGLGPRPRTCRRRRRVGAERARDHGALRVQLGLLGRELAAADELGDERVVVGQLLERAVAEQVGARVADVADRDASSVVDERDGHRRAHPRGRGVVARALVDAAVRLLDQRRRRARSPPASPPSRALAERRGRERARRSRRPARRPSRRRPRRAAARRRRRPRCGGACGRVACSPSLRLTSLIARTSGRSRRRGRRRPAASLRSRVSRIAVHERAVRRADVLDPDAVAARLEARVPRRGELVAVERDVVVARRGRS